MRHSARKSSSSELGCFPGRKSFRGLGEVVVRSWFLLVQPVPDLHDLSPTCRKHTILKAIEVPAVYWGNKLPSSKVIHHFYGQIVFAKSLSKLEVLIKHGSQRQGNRLYSCVSTRGLGSYRLSSPLGGYKRFEGLLHLLVRLTNGKGYLEVRNRFHLEHIS